MTVPVNNMRFSSLHEDIVVSRGESGALSWSGDYNGMSIKRAIPMNSGDRCILLLDPDANKRSAFENLLCIDRKGTGVWIARLPTSPDVFFDATICSEGLLTHTWSGMKIVLDENTGAELKRIFVK